MNSGKDHLILAPTMSRWNKRKWLPSSYNFEFEADSGKPSLVRLEVDWLDILDPIQSF